MIALGQAFEKKLFHTQQAKPAILHANTLTMLHRASVTERLR
jgi:hypothetical protein